MCIKIHLTELIVNISFHFIAGKLAGWEAIGKGLVTFVINPVIKKY